MYLLHMPSSRYRFPSRPFFPSVFSFRAVLTSVPTFNTAAPLEATSSFLLLPLFFTPLHTQWIPFSKSKQLWRNEASPERLGWNCSRHLHPLGKFSRRPEKRWQSLENTVTQGEGGPHSWGHARQRQGAQPLKSTAPEACPCLSWSLPVLGWCRALTPTEKGQGIPKCSGWWHRGGGRTVGLRGARRQQALLSTVLCSRTKDAAQRLHPGLPWRAPRCRPLVTQTQVMTSATSIPWDSPQARSLLSPLPFLPHQRVSGCPSDSNSEKRQEAAEDLF